jgi:hypothetical protein
MSVRPITDTLRHIGGGVFLDLASEQMAELIRAIDVAGGGGSLTLTISAKKTTRGGAMLLTAKSTLKKPAEEPMEAILFATPEGNLLADDPRQAKLDLKQVAGASDAPPAALKTV